MASSTEYGTNLQSVQHLFKNHEVGVTNLLSVKLLSPFLNSDVGHNSGTFSDR